MAFLAGEYTMTFEEPSPEERLRIAHFRGPNYVAWVEDQLKIEARLMLCDISGRIHTPTRAEWIGLNLLDRDGEK